MNKRILTLLALFAATINAQTRDEWADYFTRSEANAEINRSAEERELKELDQEDALPAPSGGDFKMSHDAGDPWYKSDEAADLTDIVLSYQTPAGGWSKHNGYSKGARKPGMLWSSQYEPGHSPHYLGTIDNRATTEEMRFLAAAHQATGREDCAAAFLKGVDYLLAAQYPNGGWPQVYPLEGGYHDGITLNDDAMTKVLMLFDEINRNDELYAFVDAPRKKQVADALARGLDCVKKMQVRQNRTLTGWCAQYDARTLEPAAARNMEPAALGSIESSNLLKFLMKLEHQDEDLIACIDGGLTWLENAAIRNLTRTKQNGKTVYVTDETSTQLYWARFYSLDDGRPIFPGRDGVIYDTFEEMAAHNKLGYDFYSTRPGSTVRTKQKKWRKRLLEQDKDD